MILSKYSKQIATYLISGGIAIESFLYINF